MSWILPGKEIVEHLPIKKIKVHFTQRPEKATERWRKSAKGLLWKKKLKFSAQSTAASGI